MKKLSFALLAFAFLASPVMAAKGDKKCGPEHQAKHDRKEAQGKPMKPHEECKTCHVKK